MKPFQTLLAMNEKRAQAALAAAWGFEYTRLSGRPSDMLAVALTHGVTLEEVAAAYRAITVFQRERPKDLDEWKTHATAFYLAYSEARQAAPASSLKPTVRL